jgi:hypothetical protein
MVTPILLALGKRCNQMVDWEFKRDPSNRDLLDWKSAEAVLEAEQFECCALWPLMWKSKAQGLLVAADKIYQAYYNADKREMARLDSGNYTNGTPKGQELEDSLDTMYLFPIFLLLVGYAIENLLKGIIYSKNPDLIVETNKNLELNKNLRCHKLTKLYKEVAKVTELTALDNETEEILIILEQCVIWQGRYSLPLNLQQFKNKKQISSSQMNIKKINALISQISSVLNKIPNPPTHMEKRTRSKDA